MHEPRLTQLSGGVHLEDYRGFCEVFTKVTVQYLSMKTQAWLLSRDYEVSLYYGNIITAESASNPSQSHETPTLAVPTCVMSV